MEGLRIHYPCISIDFETIVNSLRTVHEDVHWEQSPQEEASQQSVKESNEVREIDVMELRMQLACDICGDVMRCPCTSLACLHSYCRSCIEEAIEEQPGEKSCPVEGCQMEFLDRRRSASLRHQPFWTEHPMIVGDGVLAAVIKKFMMGGFEDSDEAMFDTWIPTLGEETEGIEDLGSLRCIPVQHHRPSLEVSDEDAVMDIHSIEQQWVPHESTSASEQSMDTSKSLENVPVYMTVAVFPFEDEDVHQMEDNYFYVPSEMTGSQFRRYLEQRCDWSLMMLYCRDICLTDTSQEAMTLDEICDAYWRPYLQEEFDVFTLRYRVDSTTETESVL